MPRGSLEGGGGFSQGISAQPWGGQKVAGGFLAPKAFKKTKLKNKKQGRNTNAGRPRILMCLWFYPPHPHPPVQHPSPLGQLRRTLEDWGVGVVDCKDSPERSVRAVLNTIKEGGAPELLEDCRHWLALRHNAYLWANDSERKGLFEQCSRPLDDDKIYFCFSC